MSLDPLAVEFPAWSAYNYVLGNPVMLTDPNGLSPIDPTDPNSDGRWNFYRKFGHATFNAVLNHRGLNGYKGLYIVAQRRSENGFKATTPGNNPMNIKGSGDLGQITLTTVEYIKGKRNTLKQNFANFSTMEKGFEGYIDLLQNNFPDAYDALTDNNKTIADFSKGLTNGVYGVYGTDPNYEQTLINMFNGVKKDYIRWFTHNINSITIGVNGLKRLLSAGIDIKQQSDIYEEIQKGFVQRAQYEIEKENVSNTN